MPQGPDFPYDVFLSHSAKDKAVVRPLAERLRQDERLRKAEFLHAAFCLLPFRFDPLNRERRFIPSRLDGRTPQSFAP